MSSMEARFSGVDYLLLMLVKEGAKEREKRVAESFLSPWGPLLSETFLVYLRAFYYTHR